MSESIMTNGFWADWRSRGFLAVAAPRLVYFILLCFLGLLTAFGRRDAPLPASGRWPAIPGLGHVSLPPAGSRPRLSICRRSAARTGAHPVLARDVGDGAPEMFPIETRDAGGEAQKAQPVDAHDVCDGAPEARQISSLGREPQERGDQLTNEPPEGATDQTHGV
jgi:hypothetical protein